VQSTLKGRSDINSGVQGFVQIKFSSEMEKY